MKKLQTVFAIVLLLMLIAGMTHTTSAAPQRQSGPTTWTVQVGAEAESGGWQLLRFYPDTLTINQGDSIVFKQNGADPHTVILGPTKFSPDNSFAPLAPEGVFYPGGDMQKLILGQKTYFPFGGNAFDGSAPLGAGVLGKGRMALDRNVMSYTASFTKAGGYIYICSFHAGPDQNGQMQGMFGRLTVQAAGSAYPKSVDQVNSDAQAQIATDAQFATSHDADANKYSTRPGKNGATIHTITLGADAMSDKVMAEYIRPTKPDLTIKAGDTVEWQGGGPETVTFLAGKAAPLLTIQQQRPDGATEYVVNPAILAPSSQQTSYSGGYLNSGLFQAAGSNSGPGPTSYSLIFTQPGTYQYTSLTDGDYGMKGSITVTAGDTAPLMPQTGSGELDDLTTWGLIAAAFVLVAALMLLALRLQRGRKQAS